MSNKRLTRRQKRQQELEMDNILNKKFSMKRVEPITKTQEILKKHYTNGKNIANIGTAGTGKTYLSMAMALEEIMQNNDYEKIIIIRSAVQSREQGFMPGSLNEKMNYYETPYIDIVGDLFERKDGYQILKQKGMIEFMSTSFIRGLTFDNAIIICDECQNMNYEELRTVMTRVGESSKIIFCGDTKQDDLRNSKNRIDNSGLSNFVKVLKSMEDFAIMSFDTNDIVRSKLIKDFIIAEEKVLEYN